MNSIFPGRYTAMPNQKVVVFIIGMRVNKWRSVRKWWPVFKAMTPMIKELYANKELGFLSLEGTWNFRTIKLIQYWRSFEDLEAYARYSPKHLKAWRDFYKAAGNSSEVGIFHETYIQEHGSYEAFYGNMPLYGLAKAVGQVKVTPKLDSAEKRLNNAERVEDH